MIRHLDSEKVRVGARDEIDGMDGREIDGMDGRFAVPGHCLFRCHKGIE